MHVSMCMDFFEPVTIPIHLLRTVYPSQVPATSIKIRYYEDPRPTFIGYAALIITWTKPTGELGQRERRRDGCDGLG